MVQQAGSSTALTGHLNVVQETAMWSRNMAVRNSCNPLYLLLPNDDMHDKKAAATEVNKINSSRMRAGLLGTLLDLGFRV